MAKDLREYGPMTQDETLESIRESLNLPFYGQDSQAKEKAEPKKTLNKASQPGKEGGLKDKESKRKSIQAIERSPAPTPPMLLLLAFMSLVRDPGRVNLDVPSINPQGMLPPCDRLFLDGSPPDSSQFHVFGASNIDEDSIACVRSLAHGAKSPLLCATELEPSACENFFQGLPFEYLKTTVSREELIKIKALKSLESFLSTSLRYDLRGNTASVRDAQIAIDKLIKITKQQLDTVSPKNLWEPRDDTTKELTLFLERLEVIKSMLLKKNKGVLGFIDKQIELLVRERAEIEQKMNPVDFIEELNTHHDQKKPIVVIAGNACQAFRFFAQAQSKCKGGAKDPYGRKGAAHYGNHHC